LLAFCIQQDRRIGAPTFWIDIIHKATREAMSTTRLDEITIFLITNLFTSKLNALGISNLPTAVSTVRAALADDKKKQKGRLVYAAGIFNSLVVVSGLTNRWPYLIKTNAIANILNGVKESIAARKNAELLSEAEVQSQEVRRKRSIISNFFKSRFFPSHKDSDARKDKIARTGEKKATDNSSSEMIDEMPTDSQATKANDSSTTSSLKSRFFPSQKSPKESTSTSDISSSQDETTKETKVRRKKTVTKAKALLAGKRESSMDDIIWGVFQIAFVIYDMGRWKAIGHAWMVFLLHVLEETYLNDKLTHQQKMRKFAYITVAAYFSGRLVYK
jgi:hypothetical protein